MPIYGYACAHCGHTLDALQKIADDPLKDCPECGEPALKRQLSAPRFRLKGQGWYETDFKTDNKRNLADGKSGDSDGKADNTAETKADTKTETKTETKADTKPETKTDVKPAAKKGASDNKPAATP